MKIKWREYEMIFVAVITALGIVKLIATINAGEGAQYISHVRTAFEEHGFEFSVTKNMLLPRLSIILVKYGVYLSVNLIFLRMLKGLTVKNPGTSLAIAATKVILFLGISAFLISLSANVITFYAKPYLFNYGPQYAAISMLGYNDQPLSDLFFGFMPALAQVVTVIVLILLREAAIFLLHRENPKKEFRIMVINTATVLLFIFSLIPFVLTIIHRGYTGIYICFVALVMVTYVYFTFWLYPSTEGRGLWQRHVLVKMTAVYGIGCLPLAVYFRHRYDVPMLIVAWLPVLMLTVLFSWLLYQQKKERILQLKEVGLALARSQADLQFLRSQLNPHFLFNALNTLYSTALQDRSDKTAEGIQRLGDMMRFMLHDNNLNAIPLGKEIEYMKNYIDLQKLRIQPTADIDIQDDIYTENHERPIAPMLLIPFVENAFKHGISLNDKSWITINLKDEGSQMVFEVKNSKHARRSGDPEQHHSGIGLKNVTERLKLLYPGKHRLSVTENDQEFAIQLILD